ncbi:MAG: hypothetical protein HFI90_00480 [Clostridia bacterium]|nr:hypothetical protein [Clostridia bacterium]
MKKSFFAGMTLSLAIMIVFAVVVIAAPGSEEDPVVSVSYLENIFMTKVQSYIDQKAVPQYDVVTLKEGQTLMAEKGTELILRMGTANVIASQKGGLSDVTGGVDIADGGQMPSNHLLIVPLGDGRGVKATAAEVLVMVRGGYTIQ